MSIRERILRSIERKPLYCNGVAKAVGIDAWQAREWLVKMVRDGDVIQLSNGAYERAHGGYTPEPDGDKAA